MLYTVGEMARMLDVPASTLRYYDKEGLLPFVMRSSGGIRMFQESDVEWLRVIACLKSASMSIKDIRTYIELAMQGDGTIDARLALFQKQREARLAQLQQTLATLDYKCWYYETAKAAGGNEAPKQMPLEEIPPRFHSVRQHLQDVPKQLPAEMPKAI